ncbi:30S ribosomal protein S12 methylthiotransferase RimO [Candidatus Margulisiibacteriota bacterium]
MLKKSLNNFCLISLGCPKNLVDSENVVKNLIEQGFNLVQENTSESIALVNTCAFIKPAVQETKDVIGSLIERKNKSELSHIVVMGCFPSRFSVETLEKEFPQIDLFCPIKKKHEIPKLLKALIRKKKNKKPVFPSANQSINSLTPFYYSYIKISEGCQNYCSYCTIPGIRGSYKSRPIAEVCREIEQKVAYGLKEVILVAEDTTDWGTDIYGKPSLAELLKSITSIKGLEWVRIMYAYPSKISNELIKVIANEEKICKYLDMPVQHINSSILKTMNRSYSKQELINICQELRKNIPNIALRTSLIIGFPGETEKEFKELREFIREYPFDKLGCFAYSPEKETRAYSLSNRVNRSVVSKRIDILMKDQLQRVIRKNKKSVGQNIRILYEGQGRARTYQEAPDIDNIIQVPDHEGLIPGNLYLAKIIGYQEYDLVAIILGNEEQPKK